MFPTPQDLEVLGRSSLSATKPVQATEHTATEKAPGLGGSVADREKVFASSLFGEFGVFGGFIHTAMTAF